jgi:hypothetical protein
MGVANNDDEPAQLSRCPLTQLAKSNLKQEDIPDLQYKRAAMAKK